MSPEMVMGSHAISARRSLNLLFVGWANVGINQWRIEPIRVNLSPGTSTYYLPDGTIDLLDTNLLRDGTEQVMARIGRSEYSAYPNKGQKGRPTQFYVNRGITPSLVLYPTPENGTDAVITYRIIRIADLNAARDNPLVPYLWQEALVSGLASKLSLKYAPDRLEMLKADAAGAFEIASSEDRERASLWITPDFSELLR
jgi:hypothetical protein